MTLLSHVLQTGCRFFASRFFRQKNESRGVARKATFLYGENHKGVCALPGK